MAQFCPFPFVQTIAKYIFTVRNSSYGKVMFSQASVMLSIGGMHGEGGACMAKGGMVKGGCAW